MIVEDAPDHVLIDLNAERVSDMLSELAPTRWSTLSLSQTSGLR